MTEYIGEIVSAATASMKGQWKHSGIRCHRRPRHRSCSGRIRVCENEDGYIEWECPSCGDNGVIHDWQDSPWNLSRWRSHKDEFGFEIALTEQEYDELRKCLVTSSEGDRIIYGATYTGESIILRATGEELEDFAGYLAFNANHEENLKRQRILDRVLDRIEVTLGTWSTS